jgi:dihydrofolate synthase/folylpolyglutamate synthase
MTGPCGDRPSAGATLDDWLHYQQQLHTSEIDLGLERIGRVWKRLHPGTPEACIITVAGTNGKGSCVAFLEAILIAAGYRVGAYTSPHLVRYNERIRIDGNEASDTDICSAFEQIENARGDIPLTYFEFGTLAAMLLFVRTGVDVIVLEVGLGGRLDAANLFDADGVIITSIGLDHTDWLGDDLEQIAVEKAGVMRPGQPAVIARSDMPASLHGVAEKVGAELVVRGQDFNLSVSDNEWHWQGNETAHHALPLPLLSGKHQLDNAAAVIALLDSMRERLPVSDTAIAAGLKSVSLAGRFQQISRNPLVIVDVAHNREAAAVLANAMRDHDEVKEWHAVASFYADKPIEAIGIELRELISHWHIYVLKGARAASSDVLEKKLRQAGVESCIDTCSSFKQAIGVARTAAGIDGGVVIFGSFEVAGAALEYFSSKTL